MTDTAVIVDVAVKTKFKRPSLYEVHLLNDDFTPMDFVVYILEQIFMHDIDTAFAIMLAVHNEGRGLAGIYTYEIAESKIFQTLDLATKNGHPLQLEMREIDSE